VQNTARRRSANGGAESRRRPSLTLTRSIVVEARDGCSALPFPPSGRRVAAVRIRAKGGRSWPRRDRPPRPVATSRRRRMRRSGSGRSPTCRPRRDAISATRLRWPVAEAARLGTTTRIAPGRALRGGAEAQHPRPLEDGEVGADRGSQANGVNAGGRRSGNDLEDACVGPVHWDVAGLVVEGRAPAGSEAFVADFLRLRRSEPRGAR
jgi:hypothetical protein